MQINEFINEVKLLGLNLSQDELNKLFKYYEYLEDYNKHTNLTTITKQENVYLKHFYDSLTILKAVDLKKISNLIDLGSGAGFPGIVLKIVYPHLKLTVIDANNKKTTFMDNLVKRLNLSDVSVVNARAEEFSKLHLNEFDLCVSRAVAYIDIITELAMPFIKLNGKVVLMKGSMQNEIKILEKYSHTLNIKDYKIINFNLPITLDERNLVVLTKNAETNKVMNYSQIIKRNKKWTYK